MSDVTVVSDATFEEEVLRAEKPVMVDFWAPWCAPCQMMNPTIEEVAQTYGDKIKVAKVNVDENPVTPGKFGVRSIPTLIFFNQGQLQEILVGVQPKAKIIEVITRLI